MRQKRPHLSMADQLRLVAPNTDADYRQRHTISSIELEDFLCIARALYDSDDEDLGR